MWGLDAPTLGVVVAYSALLVIAAATDFLTRRIPNWTVIGLLALFVVWMFVRPGILLPGALAAFAIALIFSACLYLVKWIGAGDSKLFSVVALFAGLKLLAGFALATALTGGGLVIAGTLINPKGAARALTAKGGAESRGVPYGVAIAVAGLIIMFAPSFGLLQARDEFGLLPAGTLSPSKHQPKPAP